LWFIIFIIDPAGVPEVFENLFERTVSRRVEAGLVCGSIFRLVDQ